MLMPDDYQRIELITGTARRRWWTTEQKLRIIEASFEPGETVSSVARRHGVAPNLLSTDGVTYQCGGGSGSSAPQVQLGPIFSRFCIFPHDGQRTQ